MISEHPIVSKLKRETPIYNTTILDFIPHTIMIRRALEIKKGIYSLKEIEGSLAGSDGEKT